MEWTIGLVNVIVSIVVACLVASCLVLYFMKLGKDLALDEHLFYRVTERQKARFGFLGFYLLVLTGVEILNRPSIQHLTKGGITFKTPPLGDSILDTFGLNISWLQSVSVTWQDAFSLGALLFLIWRFIDLQHRMKVRVAFLKERSASHSQRAAQHSLGDLNQNELERDTAGLRFAFNFSAVSFLIGILAPELTKFWQNLPFVFVTLGVFLISGIYCFIEAMKLGAVHGFTLPVLRWIGRHVLLRGTLLYLAAGIAGWALFVLIPSWIDVQQVTDVVSAVSKVLAGAFLILAAHLVAWGRDGLKERLDRFMLLTCCSGLIYPVWWITMHSLDTAMVFYTIALVIYPLLALLFSARPSSGGDPTLRSVAYVQSIAWLPFAAGKATRNQEKPKRFSWTYAPYTTSEDLLEDMVGHDARTGAGFMRAWAWRPWHLLMRRLSVHKDYDAIVMDLSSALRLKSALKKQGRNNQYFIVAGVCKSSLKGFRALAGEIKSPPSSLAWPGSPYLDQNKRMESCISEAVISAIGGEKIEIGYLPPYCSGHADNPYFPNSVDIVFAPEPFAMQARTDLHSRKVAFAEIDLGSVTWLTNHYHVLLVRNDDMNFSSELIDILVEGRRALRNLTGPVMFDSGLAARVASELDPSIESGPKLDPRAVNLSVSRVCAEDLLVIGDPGVNANRRVEGQENLRSVLECHHSLCSANIVDLTDDDVIQMCRPRIAAGVPLDSPPAVYPVEMSLLHVEDSPGRLRDVLNVLGAQGTSLTFLLAQRIGVDPAHGFVFMLPSDPKIVRALEDVHVMKTEVVGQEALGFIAVPLEDNPGSLKQVLDILADTAKVNLDACYCFSMSGGRALALIRLDTKHNDRLDEALRILEQGGHSVIRDLGAWLQAPKPTKKTSLAARGPRPPRNR